MVGLMSVCKFLILWLFGLLIFTSCVKVPSYEFDLHLYQVDESFLDCPSGWLRFRNHCYFVIKQETTFQEADILCKRYGGYLVKIDGYNTNKGLGQLIRNHNISYVWIGLQRRKSGKFWWSDGELAAAEDGFWSNLSPPIISDYDVCTVMNVSIYGDNRWTLSNCDIRFSSICQTSTCIAGQFRCSDGSGCISDTRICDGVYQCSDGSDEQKCPGSCGGHLQGYLQTFQSPNYPQTYPKSTSCVWKLETPIGTRVRLKFESFSIEELYDKVIIHDGSSENDPLVGTYSGSVLPNVPYSSSNFLLVIFQSDQDNQMSGFNASFSAVPKDECGSEMIASNLSQWLTSPNFPNSYPNSILCDWVIKSDNTMDLISLQFHSFSLDTSDFIEIRQGESIDSPLYGRYSGSILPPVFVSTSHSLFVRLYTDNTKANSGFNASYNIGCNNTIVNGYARIMSPGFGITNYLNNKNCNWTVIDPEERNSTILFNHFDTEEFFDNVTVHSRTDDYNYNANGPNIPPAIRIASKIFYVSFNPDSQVSRRGWYLTVSYDCPALNLSNHLQKNSSTTIFGTYVLFSCDNGYQLTGTNLLICDIGGRWSASTPTCKVIDCGSPALPNNMGLVSLDTTHYLGRAVYKCNRGYTMTSGDVSICQSNGLWSPPYCSELNCPKLVMADGLRFISNTESHYVYGDIIKYSCDSNYRLIGASKVYCTENGTWSKSTPSCKPALCPPVYILNGNTNATDIISGGDYVNIQCNHGYTLNGSSVIHCGLNGIYSSLPSCIDVNECETNVCGEHHCQNVPGLYKCVCNHGYQNLPGDETVCTDIDECSLRLCNEICTNYDGGYRCDCVKGHHLYTEDTVRVVKKKVLWPNSTCIAKCANFTVSNGGHVIADTDPLVTGEYIAPTTVSIYCPRGTLPDGSVSVECQLSGKWNDTVTTCLRQQCPQISPPSNGHVTLSSINRGYNSVANYSCDDDFELIGVQKRFCQPLIDNTQFQWTGNQLYCKEKACPVLPDPANGQAIYTSTTIGSTMEYKCNCGYQLIGSQSRTCQPEGLWDGRNAICAPSSICQPPVTPSSITVSKVLPFYTVGSEVNFQCSKGGYEISDTALKCVVDRPKNNQRPKFNFVFEMKFKFSGFNQSCGKVYVAEIVQLFTNLVQNNCTAPKPSLKVKVIIRTGNVLDVDLTVELSEPDGGTFNSVCQCKNQLQQTVNAGAIQEKLNNYTLNGSSDTTCPAVRLKTVDHINITSHWSCDAGYEFVYTRDVCTSDLEPVCYISTDCPGIYVLPTSTKSTTTLPVTSTTTLPTTSTTTLPTTNTTALPTTSTTTLSTSTNINNPISPVNITTNEHKRTTTDTTEEETDDRSPSTSFSVETPSTSDTVAIDKRTTNRNAMNYSYTGSSSETTDTSLFTGPSSETTDTSLSTGPLSIRTVASFSTESSSITTDTSLSAGSSSKTTDINEDTDFPTTPTSTIQGGNITTEVTSHKSPTTSVVMVTTSEKQILINDTSTTFVQTSPGILSEATPETTAQGTTSNNSPDTTSVTTLPHGTSDPQTSGEEVDSTSRSTTEVYFTETTTAESVLSTVKRETTTTDDGDNDTTQTTPLISPTPTENQIKMNDSESVLSSSITESYVDFSNTPSSFITKSEIITESSMNIEDTSVIEATNTIDQFSSLMSDNTPSNSYLETLSTQSVSSDVPLTTSVVSLSEFAKQLSSMSTSYPYLTTSFTSTMDRTTLETETLSTQTLIHVTTAIDTYFIESALSSSDLSTKTIGTDTSGYTLITPSSLGLDATTKDSVLSSIITSELSTPAAAINTTFLDSYLTTPTLSTLTIEESDITATMLDSYHKTTSQISSTTTVYEVTTSAISTGEVTTKSFETTTDSITTQTTETTTKDLFLTTESQTTLDVTTEASSVPDTTPKQTKQTTVSVSEDTPITTENKITQTSTEAITTKGEPTEEATTKPSTDSSTIKISTVAVTSQVETASTTEESTTKPSTYSSTKKTSTEAATSQADTTKESTTKPSTDSSTTKTSTVAATSQADTTKEMTAKTSTEAFTSLKLSTEATTSQAETTQESTTKLPTGYWTSTVVTDGTTKSSIEVNTDSTTTHSPTSTETSSESTVSPRVLPKYVIQLYFELLPLDLTEQCKTDINTRISIILSSTSVVRDALQNSSYCSGYKINVSIEIMIKIKSTAIEVIKTYGLGGQSQSILTSCGNSIDQTLFTGLRNSLSDLPSQTSCLQSLQTSEITTSKWKCVDGYVVDDSGETCIVQSTVPPEVTTETTSDTVTTAIITTTTTSTTTTPSTTTTQSTTVSTTTKPPTTVLTTTTTTTTPAPTLPPTSRPFYLIQVAAVYTGTNLTWDGCINAMREQIEEKVNAVSDEIINGLSSWKQCSKQKDIILLTKTGKISVIPEKLSIVIKYPSAHMLDLLAPFAIQSESDGTDAMDAVTSCATSAVERHINDKFNDMLGDVNPGVCYVTYNSFEITFSGWSCSDYYEYDQSTQICNLVTTTTSTTPSTMPSTSTHTDQVSNIRYFLPYGKLLMSLDSFGNVSVTDEDYCAAEYRQTLISILESQTVAINAGSQSDIVTNCRNIYISLYGTDVQTDDVVLSVSQHLVATRITVKLFATADNVTITGLQICVGYLAGIFMEGYNALLGQSTIPSSNKSQCSSVTIATVNFSNYFNDCTSGYERASPNDAYFLCLRGDRTKYIAPLMMSYSWIQPTTRECIMVSLMPALSTTSLDYVRQYAANPTCTSDIILQHINLTASYVSTFKSANITVVYELSSLTENVQSLLTCSDIIIRNAKTYFEPRLSAIFTSIIDMCGTTAPTVLMNNVTGFYQCPDGKVWDQNSSQCINQENTTVNGSYTSEQEMSNYTSFSPNYTQTASDYQSKYSNTGSVTNTLPTVTEQSNTSVTSLNNTLTTEHSDTSTTPYDTNTSETLDTTTTAQTLDTTTNTAQTLETTKTTTETLDTTTTTALTLDTKTTTAETLDTTTTTAETLDTTTTAETLDTTTTSAETLDTTTTTTETLDTTTTTAERLDTTTTTAETLDTTTTTAETFDTKTTTAETLDTTTTTAETLDTTTTTAERLDTTTTTAETLDTTTTTAETLDTTTTTAETLDTTTTTAETLDTTTPTAETLDTTTTTAGTLDTTTITAITLDTTTPKTERLDTTTATTERLDTTTATTERLDTTTNFAETFNTTTITEIIDTTTATAELVDTTTTTLKILDTAASTMTELSDIKSTTTELSDTTSTTTELHDTTSTTTELPDTTSTTTELPETTSTTTGLPDITSTTTKLPDTTSITTVLPDITSTITELLDTTSTTTELPDTTSITTVLPDTTSTITELLDTTSTTTELLDTTPTTTELPDTTSTTTELPDTTSITTDLSDTTSTTTEVPDTTSTTTELPDTTSITTNLSDTTSTTTVLPDTTSTNTEQPDTTSTTTELPDTTFTTTELPDTTSTTTELPGTTSTTTELSETTSTTTKLPGTTSTTTELSETTSTTMYTELPGTTSTTTELPGTTSITTELPGTTSTTTELPDKTSTTELPGTTFTTTELPGTTSSTKDLPGTTSTTTELPDKISTTTELYGTTSTTTELPDTTSITTDLSDTTSTTTEVPDTTSNTTELPDTTSITTNLSDTTSTTTELPDTTSTTTDLSDTTSTTTVLPDTTSTNTEQPDTTSTTTELPDTTFTTTELPDTTSTTTELPGTTSTTTELSETTSTTTKLPGTTSTTTELSETTSTTMYTELPGTTSTTTELPGTTSTTTELPGTTSTTTELPDKTSTTELPGTTSTTTELPGTTSTTTELPGTTSTTTELPDKTSTTTELYGTTSTTTELPGTSSTTKEPPDTTSTTTELSGTTSTTTELPGTTSTTTELPGTTSTTTELPGTTSTTTELPDKTSTTELPGTTSTTTELPGTTSTTTELPGTTSTTTELPDKTSTTTELYGTTSTTTELPGTSSTTKELPDTTSTTTELSGTTSTTTELPGTTSTTTELPDTTSITTELPDTGSTTTEWLDTTSTNTEWPDTTSTTKEWQNKTSTTTELPGTTSGTPEWSGTTSTTTELPDTTSTTTGLPGTASTNIQLPDTVSTTEQLNTSYTTTERSDSTSTTTELPDTTYTTTELPGTTSTTTDLSDTISTTTKWPGTTSTTTELPGTTSTTKELPDITFTTKQLNTTSTTTDLSDSTSITTALPDTTSTTTELSGTISTTTELNDATSTTTELHDTTLTTTELPGTTSTTTELPGTTSTTTELLETTSTTTERSDSTSIMTELPDTTSTTTELTDAISTTTELHDTTSTTTELHDTTSTTTELPGTTSTTTELPDATSTTTELPDTTSTTTELPDTTSTTTDLPDTTSTTTELPDATSITTELPEATSTTTELPDTTSTTTELPDTTSTTTKLPDTTSTTTELPDTTPTTKELPDTTSTTTELPNATSTTTELPDTTSTTTELPEATSTTTELPDTTSITSEQPDTTSTTSGLSDTASTTTELFDSTSTTLDSSNTTSTTKELYNTGSTTKELSNTTELPNTTSTAEPDTTYTAEPDTTSTAEPDTSTTTKLSDTKSTTTETSDIILTTPELANIPSTTAKLSVTIGTTTELHDSTSISTELSFDTTTTSEILDTTMTTTETLDTTAAITETLDTTPTTAETLDTTTAITETLDTTPTTPQTLDTTTTTAETLDTTTTTAETLDTTTTTTESLDTTTTTAETLDTTTAITETLDTTPTTAETLDTTTATAEKLVTTTTTAETLDTTTTTTETLDTTTTPQTLDTTTTTAQTLDTTTTTTETLDTTTTTAETLDTTTTTAETLDTTTTTTESLDTTTTTAETLDTTTTTAETLDTTTTSVETLDTTTTTTETLDTTTTTAETFDTTTTTVETLDTTTTSTETLDTTTTSAETLDTTTTTAEAVDITPTVEIPDTTTTAETLDTTTNSAETLDTTTTSTETLDTSTTLYDTNTSETLNTTTTTAETLDTTTTTSETLNTTTTTAETLDTTTTTAETLDTTTTTAEIPGTTTTETLYITTAAVQTTINTTTTTEQTPDNTTLSQTLASTTSTLTPSNTTASQSTSLQPSAETTDINSITSTETTSYTTQQDVYTTTLQTTTSATEQPMCYICASSKTDAFCNTYTQQCSQGESCQTVVIYTNKKPLITKKCAETQSCLSSTLTFTCDPTNYSTTCVYCCSTDLCNAETTFLEWQGKRKKRKRRAVKQIQRKKRYSTGHPLAFWNSSIPTCIDTVPPVFQNCPDKDMFVYKEPWGPVIVNVTTPTAVDNSGISPRVTVIPSDFRQPYLFRESTAVTFMAEDESGNSAQCVIQVNLVEKQPLTITCPVDVVFVPYATVNDTVHIGYNNTGVTSTGSATHITYYPPVGTAIRIKEHVNVMATVFDAAGNGVSCNFTYEATRDDQLPEYTIKVVYTLPSVSTNNTCAEKYGSKLMWIFNNISFTECQDNFMMFPNIVQNHKEEKLLVTVAITFSNLKVLDLEKMEHCGNMTTQRITSLGNITLDPPGCDKFTLTATPEDTEQKFSCSNFTVFNSSRFCTYCRKGTFGNDTSGACEVCPLNQTDVPAECSICSEGRTACLDTCKPGEFSPTAGLQPCTKCKVGTYTDTYKSTICQSCPTGKSTTQTGTSSLNQCYDECPTGFYSETGLVPCKPCPKMFYNNMTKSQSCIECPPGLVTTTEGSSSPTQCIDPQVCSSLDVCKNGGVCVPVDSGRYFTCQCNPGFYGDFCEHDRQECNSGPCVQGICVDGIDSYTCVCNPGYTGYNCDTYIDSCSSVDCHYGTCIEGSNTCLCYDGFQGNLTCVEKDECNPDPCEHGGVCIDVIDDFVCNCTGTGYEGKNCSILSQKCYNNSCLNDGVCHPHTQGYSCSCAPGYTGEFCEINIDDCNGHYCRNSAVCIDGVNSYTCVCQPGFSGSHCNVNIQCEDNPCVNKATCVTTETGFMCHCIPGYTGTLCEVNIDECKTSRCNTDRSTCQDEINGYKCQCLPGWTGTYCDDQIDECLSSPCAHGSICTNLENQFSCDCVDGFTGHNCSTNIDGCQSSPCLNDGICKDSDNGYTCICGTGFSGSRCQECVDLCSSLPCENNGSCLSLVDTFSCNCMEGWTGQTCDTMVNNCLSLPCYNNATCQNVVNDFICRCQQGYTGVHCETDINECLSDPCLHDGDCMNVIGGYSCTCQNGFAGPNCNIVDQPCPVCQNGGRDCYNGQCICLPGFVGPDCGKEREKWYDLYFHPNSSINTGVTSMKNRNHLTLCLWLKIINEESSNIVTLTTVDSSDPTVKQDILSITTDRLHLSYFTELTIDYTLPRESWNHICVTWNSEDNGHWNLYINGVLEKDGSGYGNGQQLPASQKMLLGSDQTKSDGVFHGIISQLNMYDIIINDTDLSSASKNCSFSMPTGTVFKWQEFYGYVTSGVEVIEPSLCGSDGCVSDQIGEYCNTTKDTVPPVVIECPDFVQVVATKRLNIVNWTEPKFSDNVEIVNIVQSHRSGQVFAYGEYDIIYIAYDAENNTATCTFTVYVIPSNCTMPDIPSNAIRSCSSWSEGISCVITCKNPERYKFVEEVPPFYKCGREGFWDPPRGEVFTFPTCAESSQPSGTIKGEMIFQGPLCSNNFKEILSQNFIINMNRWSVEYDMCPGKVCNFSNITVSCFLPIRRRRRSTKRTYLVVFDIPVNGSIVSEGEDVLPLTKLETMVKNEEFNTKDFSCDPNSVVVKPYVTCQTGQILVNGLCVNCARGTYHDNSSNSCLLCPRGEYTDIERQITCQSCGTGRTTEDQGASSSSECYEICLVGNYYDKTTSVCKSCDRGYYQDETGRTSCKSCGNGQTTHHTGSTSAIECQSTCRAGTELSVLGTCEPCVIGTYKSSDSQDSCQPCPYNYSTQKTGATSIDQCSVLSCPADYFYDVKAEKCRVCPPAYHQPTAGQNMCIPCTKFDTRPKCLTGEIDECALHEDNCHQYADCVDTTDSYECHCKFGYKGNGTFCVDKCEGTCDRAQTCFIDNTGEPQCQTHTADSFPLAALAGGVSSVVLVIIMIVVSVFVYKRRSRKKTKERRNNYQTMDRVHRELEVVTYPRRIPITGAFRTNPAYSDSELSDPTFLASPGTLWPMFSDHHEDLSKYSETSLRRPLRLRITPAMKSQQHFEIESNKSWHDSSAGSSLSQYRDDSIPHNSSPNSSISKYRVNSDPKDSSPNSSISQYKEDSLNKNDSPVSNKSDFSDSFF